MSSSRSPLRSAVLVALVLTIVVVMVDATVRSAADDPDRDLGFLDQMVPITAHMADAGEALEALRGDLPGLTPELIQRRLTEIEAVVDAAEADVVLLDPPDELVVAHSLLVSTVDLRARAVDAVADGVDLLLTGAPLLDVVDAFRVGDPLLRSSDQLAVRLAEEVSAVSGSQAVVERPWWGAGRWSAAAWIDVVTSARASGNLARVVDVAVLAISVEPAPVVTEPGVVVLATDDVLTVTVVVGSRGSVPVTGSTVRLLLTVDGQEGVAAEQTVDLAPGARRAVIFDGVEPPATGVANLVVTIDPAEGEPEDLVEDNQRLLRLRVRSPDETTTSSTTTSTTSTTSPDSEAATGAATD